jgi:hypothetical protein
VQSALSYFEGIDHLNVKVGKVVYAGSANRKDVISQIESKTPFQATSE